MSKQADVVILGAGPGGYVAAIRASQLGLRTIVVEKDELGGVCLNWGCIPTKALLKSAEAFEAAKHGALWGFKAEGVTCDIQAMVARSRQISGTLTRGIQHLLKKNGVTVVKGVGRCESYSHNQHHIKVTRNAEVETLSAPHVIIATGARPFVLKGFETDPEKGSDQIVWTAREAMTPKTLPNSLLVVGSGAIGLEFASFYKTLGVDVTLVELQPALFPSGDPEISVALYKILSEKGITLHTSTKVESWTPHQGGARATLVTPRGTETIDVDHILVAAGTVGNTEGLGLEELGCEIVRGRIVTHRGSATNIQAYMPLET